MDRKEFESLIKSLNDADAPSVHHIEDCIEFSECTQDLKKLAEDLDPDEHRWYWISTTVYKVGDWFMGVQGPSGLKSESMEWSDIGMEVQAFEMEEFTTVSWRAIK